MSERSLCAVVLAAGAGTRMKSSRPKPLHLLCGRPMVVHVLDSLRGVSTDWAVMVVGHGAERVVKTLSDSAMQMPLHYVEQTTQNGTGDAVAIAMASLPEKVSDEADDADILILPGDTPLLEADTVAALIERHRATDAAATLLTVNTPQPTGYGRIVRDSQRRVRRIVEERDANDDEKAIEEVNAGVYCFKTSLLGPALRRLNTNNAQGELLLTDAIQLLADAGHRVETATAPDIAWAVGVNDRSQLAAAEAEMRRRINEGWMREGVTMIDPEHTYVDMDVLLSHDVCLRPNTRLTGKTTIAEGAEIGPDTHLTDTVVGRAAVVRGTTAELGTIGEAALVGPFVVMDPGAEVGNGEIVRPFTHVTASEG